MKVRIVLTAALTFALAGCAGSGPGGADDAGQPPASSEVGGPIRLIGLWTVADTDEQPGTVLRVAPQKQLSLWRACGALTGSWAGAQDVFLADLHGGSGNCGDAVTPSWLKSATGYGVDGADMVLTDRAGKQLARLVPGGKPKVGPDIDPAEAAPPVISDEDRAALTQTTQIPATLTRAEAAQVVGRWVPASGGGPAFADFKDDRTWTGSDGCNGNGGRWTVVESAMVATAGASTLMACDGAPVPTWLSGTAMAGFDNGVLVLLDAKGAEVARLKKG